jgi:hypothetical protein
MSNGGYAIGFAVSFALSKEKPPRTMGFATRATPNRLKFTLKTAKIGSW